MTTTYFTGCGIPSYEKRVTISIDFMSIFSQISSLKQTGHHGIFLIGNGSTRHGAKRVMRK
ncbi:hypothetical protein [Dehalobacter restrictus]|uniref:hypothetical protein n=1 Tax=Dehalobacter restrictus TaxID=55583 RepID=UPI00138AEAB7|nr:hypothetical protein [Dehalobacter restrictus]